MLKSELLAAEYRRNANDALQGADTSALNEVRKRRRAAAQSWILLAEMQDRRTIHAHELAQRVARAGDGAGDAPECG
jgi:hypothetical protein